MLRGYAEIAATAPDELTVMAGFLGAGGQMLLFLFPAWSGDPARGQDAITALQQLGTPVMAQVAPMPYSGALGMFNQSVVNGRHYALATRWLPGLTDDTAAMLIAGARSALAAIRYCDPPLPRCRGTYPRPRHRLRAAPRPPARTR